MRCPICKKELPEPPLPRPFRPFCSDRCKMADLGKWFDGGYAVAGEAVEISDDTAKDEEPKR